MAAKDYALNAQIRTIFIQRWVDLSVLDYGVTNGVVYLRGTLRHHLTRANLDATDKVQEEEVALVKNLDRVLRQVRGIRDVVYQLANVYRRGSVWLHR